MRAVRSGSSRYYQIGGLVIKIESDLPIASNTFSESIEKFQTNHPVTATAAVHHKFSLPDITKFTLGNPIYRRIPWAVYSTGENFCYLGISNEKINEKIHQVAFFSNDHTEGWIYHRDGEAFLHGGITSLTLFPTDQILLCRLLADKQGCIFHSAAIDIGGKGFVFAGHSGAGKSTTMTLLRNSGEILCDDRNILRRHTDGWRLYGTWSHGDIPDVSPTSVPLRAILLLEQADENRLIPITDRREIVRKLPFFIVKPLVTADWWEKTLDLVGQIAREVPVYRLRFQKSERILDALAPLLD